MTTKGAFISFDYDHDNDLRGNLVAQAKNPESPFSITDWSVRHRIDENWRREVRDRIRRADLTIVICGEHTHDATGVAAEITITREEGKPYFLLKGAEEGRLARNRQWSRRTDEMAQLDLGELEATDRGSTIVGGRRIRQRPVPIHGERLTKARSMPTYWSNTRSTYSRRRTSAPVESRRAVIC